MTTNGKKPDPFIYDQEDLETQEVFDNIREGLVVMTKDHVTREKFISEQDIPSIFLRGAIAGATSQDKSEDPNFQLIRDSNAPTGVVLTDQEIRDVQDASCRRYNTDPQYQGIIDSYKVFIIGKGFHVSPVDEMPEVADYLKSFSKINRMDGRDRSVVEEVLKAGEVFLRKFTKAGDKDAKIPALRTLRYFEISKIVMDDSDPEKVLEYWRPYKNANGQIETEKIPADEIFHIKYGDQKRGLPPFMSTLMQCAYYDDWLFNRIVFNRLKTAYVLEEIVEGSPAQVSSQDDQQPNAIKTGQRGKIIKRIPKPGSKLTHNKAVEYKWLKPEVGAEDAKEDGRAIRMSICSGAKVPEFILGDASQSNYANSVVAQNPFVRNIEWFQDFFSGPFGFIYEWAVMYGIAAGVIPRLSTETLARESRRSIPWYKIVPKRVQTLVNRMFEKERKDWKLGDVIREQEDETGDFMTSVVIPTKTEVDINWPNLIAQDLLRDTQAYQLHQSMGIVSTETLAQKLGYDWNEEKRKLNQERDEMGDQNPDGLDDEQRDNEIDKGDELNGDKGRTPS